MLDKRQWQRLDVDLSAVCSCSSLPKEKFSLRVININETGTCCVVPLGLKLGQKISFEMELPGRGIVRAVMKVVWSGYFEREGEYRAGLKIVEMPDHVLGVFLAYYRSHFLRHGI
ncbi:MAG: hypothetical protein GX606_07550 [Elusimicrobia bacterium]|nr:hypothetical protein [Elusimicrobiota bacterium]